MHSEVERSGINSILFHMENAFEHLNKDVQLSDLERVAFDLHTCMSSPNRLFHNVEHINEMCEGLEGLDILGVLYHDVIYYQIDNGFCSCAPFTPSDFINEAEGFFVLKENEDNEYHLCRRIFGFDAGTKINAYSGLNEFFSALYAAKALKAFLQPEELLRVLACIEGTIPFRSSDENGKTSFDKLHGRLIKLNEDHKLNMSDSVIRDMVKAAVGVSNKDVENFADPDPRNFLNKTWLLLPESNATFHFSESYTISYYRKALGRMSGFLEHLDDETIFRQFDGFPNDERFKEIYSRAKTNLKTAREYFGLKLLTIGIIECLAELTGGDAPLSMFMGSLKRDGKVVQRVEQYLPRLRTNSKLKYNEDVILLAEFGRNQETFFDLRNAPVSSFIYKYLGHEATIEYVVFVRLYFEGNLTPEEFLEKLNPGLRNVLVRAFASIVEFRSERLLALL